MYTHSTLKHSMVVVRLYFQYIKLWETVVTIRLYFYRYDYGSYINFIAPDCTYVSNCI